jgi:hypothetical protein
MQYIHSMHKGVGFYLKPLYMCLFTIFFSCSVTAQIQELPTVTVFGQTTNPGAVINYAGFQPSGQLTFFLPMPPGQNNSNYPNPVIASGWGSLISDNKKMKAEALSDAVENDINSIVNNVKAHKSLALQIQDAFEGKIDVNKFEKFNLAVLPGSDSRLLKTMLDIQFKSGNSIGIETNSVSGGGTQIIGQWISNALGDLETKVRVAEDGSLGLSINTKGSIAFNNYNLTLGMDNINKDDGNPPGFNATLTGSFGKLELIAKDGAYGVTGSYKSGAGSYTGNIIGSNQKIAASIGYNMFNSSIILKYDSMSNGSLIGQQLPEDYAKGHTIGLLLNIGGL